MLGKSKINQCTITLTRNCNLRCEFCYAKKTEYAAKEFIEYEYVKKIVDLCNDAKVKYVVLTGGEPILYPNILDVLKYIKSKKHKMIPTIATNGTMLDDFDFCKKLIDSGLAYVDISLKGKDGEEFAKVTGHDNFSQQMKAIQNLSKTSIDFTCSMVINHNNVNSFCEGIKNAYDNGAKKFSFTFVIDNEESDISEEEYLQRYSPFALVDSFVSHIDELNSITGGEWWIEYSCPMCVYTEEQLELLKGRLAAPCQIYYKNAITFDAKMNLIPCSMNIDSVMGKFGLDFSTYKEFKKLSKCNPYKSTVESLSNLPSESCKSCKYLKDCQGGCTFFWMHYAFDTFNKFKEKQTNKY